MYGGCLPMLIQMPLFFAYFRVLQRGRAAPGALVLAHRSLRARPAAHSAHPHHHQHVPHAVHHALAGHGPRPARMMAFMMPVIFGFILWHYASGLALYWGTGNLINLAIQLGINQSRWARRCTPSPPAGAPPRRRRSLQIR
jgi:YidC/Oxa1 family membrane protein insertase